MGNNSEAALGITWAMMPMVIIVIIIIIIIYHLKLLSSGFHLLFVLYTLKQFKMQSRVVEVIKISPESYS